MSLTLIHSLPFSLTPFLHLLANGTSCKWLETSNFALAFQSRTIYDIFLDVKMSYTAFIFFSHKCTRHSYNLWLPFSSTWRILLSLLFSKQNLLVASLREIFLNDGIPVFSFRGTKPYIIIHTLIFTELKKVD